MPIRLTCGGYTACLRVRKFRHNSSALNTYAAPKVVKAVRAHSIGDSEGALD